MRAVFIIIILSAFFAGCAQKGYNAGPQVFDCSTLQGDQKEQCLQNNGAGYYNTGNRMRQRPVR